MRSSFLLRALSALATLATLAMASFLPVQAHARVVSYAPVTRQQAIPALQQRTNRRFVLLESDGWLSWGPAGVPELPSPLYGARGHVVVYDSRGEEEPRVVLPVEGDALFTVVAAQEATDGSLRILAVTDARSPADPSLPASPRLVLSVDGGRSFRDVALPAGLLVPKPTVPIWAGGEDFGGPFCRGRNPYVRVGTDKEPFLVLLAGARENGTGVVAAIGADAAVEPLADAGPVPGGTGTPALVGGSASGDAVLVAGQVAPWRSLLPVVPKVGVFRVRIDGTVTLLAEAASLPYSLEGWMAGDATAYLEVDWGGVKPVSPFDSGRALFVAKAGGKVALVAAAPQASVSDATTDRYGLFAVPTARFDGAWLVLRDPGHPTVLARHTLDGGLTEKWRDPTAREVEAIHAGASGKRLLVQVHRPRPQIDQRLLKDPALALWEDGQTAPWAYDELFLNEQSQKGFVHLDVETLAAGSPFVFDSGAVWMGGALPPGSGGPSSGGSDVVQEWGVIKGSLTQRLVIPAVARAPGAAGAVWKTDLVLHNPSSSQVSLALRLVSRDGAVREAPLTLGGNELRLVPDVISRAFGVEVGSGALFLIPDGTGSLEATSRTYTTSASGTFGMSLGAVDVFAAASARFPYTFSAALQGAGFRTNVGAVNVSARPSEVRLRAAGGSGWIGRDDVVLPLETGGFSQLDAIAKWLGLPQWEAGAVSLEPLRGEVVPYLVAIDDVTNDPTAFPPDLPASVVRAIPAIVHADGANGARYRSDLFLHNASDQLRSITLAAKPWDSTEAESLVTLTLLPREGRVIRDVLRTAFAKAGVARLRFQAPAGTELSGVRVTSRAYAEAPGGGTFGLAVPPLNAFQVAGPGEALEILGPLGGPRFRTNLALVDMTAFADGKAHSVRVQVIGDRGERLQSFDVTVPVAGGLQIDDLFRSRGLGDGPPTAILRITPADGLVSAYATTIDQGTNDPAYHAAALAAKE